MNPIIIVLLVGLGLYLVYAFVSIIIFKSKQAVKIKKSKITPTKAESSILTKKSKEKVKELKSTDIIVEMKPPVKPDFGKLEINLKKPEPPKVDVKTAEEAKKAAEEIKPGQSTSLKLPNENYADKNAQPADTPIYDLQPISVEDIIRDYGKNAVSSADVIKEVESNVSESIDDAVSSKEVLDEVEGNIKEINDTLEKFDDKNVDDSYSTKYLETDEAVGLEDYNGQEDTELDITIMEDNNQFFDEITEVSPIIKTILFGDILNKKQ